MSNPKHIARRLMGCTCKDCTHFNDHQNGEGRCMFIIKLFPDINNLVPAKHLCPWFRKNASCPIPV